MQPEQKLNITGTPAAGDPLVAGQTAVASNPAPVSPTPIAPENKPAEQPKKSHGMLLSLILLAIVAVAGIGFGVYGLLKEPETVTETKVVNVMDNALAENLVRPYLGAFSYQMDVFDYDFDEATKFYLAFKNLRFDDIYVDEVLETAQVGTVQYDTINEEYQELFGNGSSLTRGNFEGRGYYVFDYSDYGQYIIHQYGGGGAGMWMFSVIKDAYYEGDNIVVEMYHDKGAACGIEGVETEYCLDSQAYFTEWNDEIDNLVERFSDQVPVYQMTFTLNNGHYVLSGVEKL